MAGKTDVKAEIREAQRAWIREVAKKMGMSASDLAVNAGVADVTLTRFLNRQDYRGLLSPLTIEQIKRYSGLPGPEEKGSRAGPKFGFSEAEQPDYKAKNFGKPVLARMIAAALEGRPDASPWLLETTSLQSRGYFKGDVVISDASIRPVPNDIVVAQTIDLRSGTAETIFRVYTPPYLVGLDDATRTPLPIDNDRTSIAGVVTDCIRSRVL